MDQAKKQQVEQEARAQRAASRGATTDEEGLSQKRPSSRRNLRYADDTRGSNGRVEDVDSAAEQNEATEAEELSEDKEDQGQGVGPSHPSEVAKGKRRQQQSSETHVDNPNHESDDDQPLIIPNSGENA